MNTPIALWDRSLKFPDHAGTTVPVTEDRRKVPQCLGSASVYRWTETGRQDTYCNELALLTVNKNPVAVSRHASRSPFSKSASPVWSRIHGHEFNAHNPTQVTFGLILLCRKKHLPTYIKQGKGLSFKQTISAGDGSSRNRPLAGSCR
jgi:hypothetical protein